MSSSNPTTTRPGDADFEARTLRETLQADPLGLAAHHDWDPAQQPPPNRWALLRLVAVVGGIIALAYLAGVGETVLLVFALILCIVLHELGHFVAAKAARIKVTEFFVGFGPRLWSVRRGETEYGVKGLPFGGYCRIIGMHNLEEVDPADEARTYRQAPTWRRLSVALAGSAVHFTLAFVLLFGMFFWSGDNGNYLPVPASSPIAAIDALTTGASPAHRAGFQLGDRIEAVDGRKFATFDALRAYIEAHPNTRLAVTVQRAGRLVTLHPTTANLEETAISGAGETKATKPTGFLGVEVSPDVHSGLGAAISNAGGAWVHVSALTVHALGRLVTFHGLHEYVNMLSSQKAADTSQERFTSPVGVVRYLHTAAGDGLPTVLYLLAVINLGLGIINLVPLLPFDGGHVAIALYEGARSRRRRYRADVAKLLPLFYLGIGLIVFLGVSSLFLDLRDLLT